MSFTSVRWKSASFRQAMQKMPISSNQIYFAQGLPIAYRFVHWKFLHIKIRGNHKLVLELVIFYILLILSMKVSQGFTSSIGILY